jgi:pimeloyl-ACP methyl ester carboxylesterase
VTAIRSVSITAPDGLRLHSLEAGPRRGPRLPVVCLPGLARTVEDFRELIAALAFDAATPRRVLALDARGRGGSEHDRDPRNYSVPVEVFDTLALLDACGIARAIFIGTSRGGLVAMALAAARPRAIAGAVFNDIGPVMEMAGLLRIKSYVGRLPLPASWEEATGLLRTILGAQFPALDAAGWEAFARRSWQEPERIEAERKLVPRYDAALARSLDAIDADDPLPVLWPQFAALAPAPVFVLRGEHSDLLSRLTVEEMRARRPDLEFLEVPGQGHAPMLSGARTLGAIGEFAKRCDA